MKTAHAIVTVVGFVAAVLALSLVAGGGRLPDVVRFAAWLLVAFAGVAVVAVAIIMI